MSPVPAEASAAALKPAPLPVLPTAAAIPEAPWENARRVRHVDDDAAVGWAKPDDLGPEIPVRWDSPNERRRNGSYKAVFIRSIPDADAGTTEPNGGDAA